MTIAGHEFLDDTIDCRCSNLGKPTEDGRCGASRGSLFLAQPEHINQLGWACVSSLTQTEYYQISAERNRYEELSRRIMVATRAAAGVY